MKPMPSTPRCIEDRIHCALHDWHPDLAALSAIHTEPRKAVVFMHYHWPETDYRIALAKLPWAMHVETGFNGHALIITPDDTDRDRAVDATADYYDRLDTELEEF